MLTGAALTATASVASAQSAAGPRRVITVPCSTPALITEINTANMVPATLRLARNCTYPVSAATPLPQIIGNVTLLGGPSTAITGTGTGIRILDVTSTGTLRVEGIFILNGSLTGAGNEGAGIRNAGSLTLNYVTLSGNVTTGSNGGGVENTTTGRALVAHTVISGNTADGGASGGGINNNGSLTLFESRLSANNATAGAAGGGGGLVTQAGATSQITQSTLDRNITAGNGGGIYNAGTTSLDRTLVERNRATLNGGGIFVAGGTVTISRSIIRANIPNQCFPLNTIPGCVN
jgi:predicted outer membrane repeat protein